MYTPLTSTQTGFTSIPDRRCDGLAHAVGLPPSIRLCVRSRSRDLDGPKTASTRIKRKREFQLGRDCASLAMEDLGRTGHVGVNPDRSPQWPDGVVGSISHSKNFACAVVAKADEYQSLGIDTEPVIPVDVVTSIATEIVAEAEWQVARNHANGLTDQEVFTVIFSAKESFYKCWYPLIGRPFSFRDVRCTPTGVGKYHVSLIGKLLDEYPAGIASKVFFNVQGGDVFSATWILRGQQ